MDLVYSKMVLWCTFTSYIACVWSLWFLRFFWCLSNCTVTICSDLVVFNLVFFLWKFQLLWKDWLHWKQFQIPSSYLDNSPDLCHFHFALLSYLQMFCFFSTCTSSLSSFPWPSIVLSSVWNNEWGIDFCHKKIHWSIEKERQLEGYFGFFVQTKPFILLINWISFDDCLEILLVWYLKFQCSLLKS